MDKTIHQKMFQDPVAVSDAELEFHWNNLIKLFGDRLPNPDHEPRRFRYYISLYKHLVKLHGGITS